MLNVLQVDAALSKRELQLHCRRTTREETEIIRLIGNIQKVTSIMFYVTNMKLILCQMVAIALLPSKC